MVERKLDETEKKLKLPWGSPDAPGDGVPPELPYDPLRGSVPDGSPFSPDEVVQDHDEVLPDNVSVEELASYKEFLWDAEMWIMEHEEILLRYKKWLASYEKWLANCQDWVQRMEAERK